ncbi:DUF6397 family protein [Streptomyces sp. NPDC048290]|uniref:DUF6397 family protein n=1 Tax=Streptomyces sp. NPDC048290 TaxID=3155811 RepID=UPI003436AB18
MSFTTLAQPDSTFWSTGRTARELGLHQKDLDLAVRLGRVRSVADPTGPGRCVTRAEIDRLRAQDGFPDTLRDSVRAVAASHGGELLGITPERLTRLAKLGLLVPVSFYVNRYRSLVWLYLAEELRDFAADERNARHLAKRLPKAMVTLVNEGLDLRPRNWRGRHLGLLLRQTEDPWAQAAAIASLLDRALVCDIVRDPYERAHLNRFRPLPPVHGSPGSPAADTAAWVMTATDTDEIDWLRTDLAQALADARTAHPAPHPAPDPTGPHHAPPPPRPTARGPLTHPPATAGPAGPGPGRVARRPRGPLSWFRRRTP